MYRSITILCACCSFLIVAAQADRRGTLGAGLHYGKPFGAFAAAREGGFVGLGATFAFALPDVPVDLGFGLNWDLMARKTFDVPIGSSASDTTGELIAKHQAYGILPLVRLRPFEGPVMPYLEAFGGARLFMTNSKVEVSYIDKPVERNYDQADIGLAWGWAAGLMVNLGESVFLELRYATSWGGEVTYVDFETIALNDEGELTFGTRTTTTQARRFHLGIAAYL